MDYTELLIVTGLMVVTTAIYFLLRKFIAWAIIHDDKWNKKHGYVGLNEKTLKIKCKIANRNLFRGYLLIMFVLLLYIVKLFIDME